MTDKEQKEQFEAWASENHYDLHHYCQVYVNAHTQAAWACWQAAQAKIMPSVILSGHELKDALEFVNPDGDDDKEQLEQDVVIVWRDAFISDDNEPMQAGYYAALCECLEEGLYGPLGETERKKEKCPLCHDTGMCEQPVAAPAGVEIPKRPKIKCPLCKWANGH